jgi:hypothetical protein
MWYLYDDHPPGSIMAEERQKAHRKRRPLISVRIGITTPVLQYSVLGHLLAACLLLLHLPLAMLSADSKNVVGQSLLVTLATCSLLQELCYCGTASYQFPEHVHP